jgi:putative transposase
MQVPISLPFVQKIGHIILGKLRIGEMQLSEIGKIVENEWIKTPEIRPDMNLKQGEFVVMPNHFHAILIIGQNEYNIQPYHGEYNNQFGPQSKNVSSIIRGFKSAVTMASRMIYPDFGWQSKFHDHIIRNHEEYLSESKITSSIILKIGKKINLMNNEYYRYVYRS